MRTEGRAVGVLTNIYTGEKRVAFDEKNHVQDHFFVKHSDSAWSGGSGNAKIGYFIYLDKMNPGKQRRDFVEHSSLTAVVGVNIGGITSPEFTYFDPVNFIHLMQISQRFTAPIGDDRTIWTIALAGGAVSVDGTELDTVINLSTVCIQTTSEVLDVFYRMQIPYSGTYYTTDIIGDDDVTPLASAAIADSLFDTGVTWINQASNPYTNWNTKWDARYIQSLTPAKTDQLAITHTKDNTAQFDPTVFRNGVNYIVSITEKPGWLIGWMFMGRETSGNTEFHDVNAIHKVVGDLGLSPLQNTFGHEDVATGPFFNSGTTQSGLGTLELNGDAWTNPDWPKLFSLTITANGGIGVGEYRLKVRPQLGFDGNTYNNRAGPLTGFSALNHIGTEGFRMHRGGEDVAINSNANGLCAEIKPVNNTTIAAAWYNEFCVADIFTGLGTRFALGTTVPLAATDICQFEVEDGTEDIYIACRATGMYKINAALDTITVYDTLATGLTGVTGCYGIAIGLSGRVWGYFDHATTAGLYYSDDNGATWTNPTFTYAVIDADPTLVKLLKADKSHADGHIAVLYDATGSGVNRNLVIAWWDFAATVAVAGAAVLGPEVWGELQNFGRDVFDSDNVQSLRYYEMQEPLTYANVVNCSPNDSWWVTSCYRDFDGNTNANYAPFEYAFGFTTQTEMIGANVESHNSSSAGFGIDENGDDALFYITKESHGDVTYGLANESLVIMVRQDLTYTSGKFHDAGNVFQARMGSKNVCYLGNLIWLFSEDAGNTNATWQYDGIISAITAIPYEVATGLLSDFDNEAGGDYGWNGAAWELDHVDSKVIHAATEDLIEGVTVNFDDDSGANTFDIGDYYTTALYDGVQLDGATTYEYDVDIYYKPSKRETAVQSANLPASASIPGILRLTIPTSGEWQDTVEMNLGTGLMTGDAPAETFYKCFTRSVPVAVNALVPANPELCLYAPSDETNIQGYLTFRIDRDNDVGISLRMGLSPIGVIGTGGDETTIAFSIEAHSRNTVDPFYEFDVVESGTVRYTTATDSFDIDLSKNIGEQICRIIMYTNGAIKYELFADTVGWITLYEAPAATVPLVDYYIDVALACGDFAGMDRIKYYYQAASDYFMYLGDGINLGCHTPGFVAIDPKGMEVTIDGSVAVNVGEEDFDTVLATGEYCSFRQGFIRFAAVDAGKSVSAKYVTVYNAD